MKHKGRDEISKVWPLRKTAEKWLNYFLVLTCASCRKHDFMTHTDFICIANFCFFHTVDMIRFQFMWSTFGASYFKDAVQKIYSENHSIKREWLRIGDHLKLIRWKEQCEGILCVRVVREILSQTTLCYFNCNLKKWRW